MNIKGGCVTILSCLKYQIMEYDIDIREHEMNISGNECNLIIQ